VFNLVDHEGQMVMVCSNVLKKGVRFIFLIYFLDLLQKINLTLFRSFMSTSSLASNQARKTTSQATTRT